MDIRSIFHACFIFLLLSISGLVTASDQSIPPLPTPIQVIPYQIQIREGEVLSQVLRKIGLRTKRRLYGSERWVQIHEMLNPSLARSHFMATDTVVRLFLPKSIISQIPAVYQKRLQPIDDPALTANSSDRTISVDYYLVWDKVDSSIEATLANICQQFGIPASTDYGFNPWLAYTKSLNQLQSSDLHSAMERPLVIPYIRVLPPSSKPTDDEEKATRERRQQELAAQEEAERNRAAIIAQPQDSKIDDILELPPEDLNSLPPEVLTQKLDDEKISELKPEQVEKIPDSVKEEKAWQMSIWDAGKPGMMKLFQSIADQTASGYIGVRYGFSLAAPTDPMLYRQQLFSLLLETRGGFLPGLRVMYDKIPTRRVTHQDGEYKFGLSRTLLGWAIEAKSPFLVDRIHVTPRLGNYKAEALVANKQSTTTSADTQEAKIKSATAVGLEIDAELAQFFYILRGWASKDFSGFAVSSQQARSTRMGLDFFVKGGGLGGNTSLSYLAFVVREDIELKNGGQGSDKKAVEIKGMSFAGLGLSLSW